MNVGSVFSGAGLLDYGLTLAGFEHAWFCESDEFRRENLRLRWPGVPVYDDIRAIGDELERPTVLAGGFPCKGVSSAGKQQGFGHPETVLWREQLRLIRLLRPRCCLVENVAALLTLHGGELFGEVLAGLAESGYECWWDVLPAAAVGAPHLRERVFVVAHAADLGPERSGPSRTGRDGLADGGAGTHADPDLSGLQAGRNGSGGDSDQAGDRAAPDAERIGDRTQAVRGEDPRSQADRSTGGVSGRSDSFDWGDYAAAIHRWEEIFGQPAPEPLVRRVDDGTPPRVHRSRLSALGDGVQVQVGELVGRMILTHLTAQQKKAGLA